MQDVAVIGAGPVGLFIAGELAKRGYSVQVFEEHSDIGNPSHCSGLFSTHIFDIVGSLGILHPVKRAEIIAPSGASLSIGDTETRGYVVDRVEFDRALARRAIKYGADLHLKERVKRIRNHTLDTTLRSYAPRVIIGADGVNSAVRVAMGVKSPELLGAAQVIAAYDFDDEELVKIWVGSSVAPGFFAWLIPLRDGLVKIGLGSHIHAWHYLKILLKRLDIQPLSVHGGAIPMTQVDRTWGEHMILVGDAAGQVKATSGGGVYPGLRAAQCACDAVDRHLSEGTTLKSYEQCWRKGIGRELKTATMLHRMYEKMDDSTFNSLIADLNDPAIVSIINKYGDIDYPSRVAWRVFRRKPGLLKYTNIAARQKKF